MGFTWVNNEISTNVVTLTESNITLNTSACQYFENSRYVLLGYNENKKQIGIKPVSKTEIDNKVYPENQLHKFSLGKSYGRISNKNFMKNLQNYTDIDFSKQSNYKRTAEFDASKQILVIQL